MHLLVSALSVVAESTRTNNVVAAAEQEHQWHQEILQLAVLVLAVGYEESHDRLDGRLCDMSGRGAVFVRGSEELQSGI